MTAASENQHAKQTALPSSRRFLGGFFCVSFCFCFKSGLTVVVKVASLSGCVEFYLPGQIGVCMGVFYKNTIIVLSCELNVKLCPATIDPSFRSTPRGTGLRFHP